MISRQLNQKKVGELRNYCEANQISLPKGYVKKSKLIDLILASYRSKKNMGPGAKELTKGKPRIVRRKLPAGGMVVSVQGPRPSMEDTYLLVSYDGMDLYAVFDGHGGSEVSDALPKMVTDLLLRPLNREMRKTSRSVKRHILQSVLQIDQQLEKLPEASEAGSTAIMILRIKNRIYMVNLGDSRAILYSYQAHSNGRRTGPPSQVLVTQDHKPHLPSESDYIIKCGGTVEQEEGDDSRVDGYLAMSRAFGDFELKYSKKNPFRGPVSCLPDIYEHQLDPQHKYCVALASDGLWDVVDEAQVMKYLHHFGFEDGCHKLVEKALKLESWDNITVISLPLP